MRAIRLRSAAALVLVFAAIAACGRKAPLDDARAAPPPPVAESSPARPAASAPVETRSAGIDDAVKARTDVAWLRRQIAALDDAVRDAMRKVVARADAKQAEAEDRFAKERFADAVDSFAEAARLCRVALDGRKLLDKLDEDRRAVAAARALAATATDSAQTEDAERLVLDAEGYATAGEIESAVSAYDKARTAFEDLAPDAGSATLEEAVAARTSMLAARAQVLGASADLDARRVEDAHRADVRPGSAADLLARAADAESAGAAALDDRRYGPARALFAAAESAYSGVLARRVERDAVVASRKDVEDAQRAAAAAFKGDARSASFERGRQALAAAVKSLDADDLDAAKRLLAEAADRFAEALVEAAPTNALVAARAAWTAASSACDAALLERDAAERWRAAKAKADEAASEADAGRTLDAVAAYRDATAALADAQALAQSVENAAKAAPIFVRLEAALGRQRKFEAEDALLELEALVPADPRMPRLRTRVADVPGPKPTLQVEIGRGATMDFVLVPRGSFVMGGDAGAADEKPAHRVVITRPFYLAKHPVTQQQWETLMGTNPSKFKEGKAPVEEVSWDECVEFLRKLDEHSPGPKFALPTEAQYEWACRGGATTKWFFGDDESALGEYAWFSSNAKGRTHAVAAKKPNAYGLYDMLGNVWEWCADWYGAYAADAQTDPVGPAGGVKRVYRGGSFGSKATTARPGARGQNAPEKRFESVGFRPARPVAAQ